MKGRSKGYYQVLNVYKKSGFLFVCKSFFRLSDYLKIIACFFVLGMMFFLPTYTYFIISLSIVLFIPYSVSLIDKRIIAHYHLADWQKVFYKKEKIGWRSTRYLLFCTFLQREPIALTTTDVDYFIERLEKEEMYKKLNIFAHPMFAFVITVIIALIGAMLAKFSLGVLLQCLAIIIIVIMVLVCYLIFYGAIANINDLKLFLFWYKEEIASHEKFEDKSISEKIKKETAIA